MGKTLNLTDREAVILERLVENELPHVAGDDEYEAELNRLLEKIND